MAKINMRDYYPFYEHDEYVEVSDELAAEMAQWERTERSQKRKKYRYRANYSLDWGNGIGQYVFFGLLHRMNTMRKSLPANNSEPLWPRFPQSSGNAFTLITY